MRTVGRPTMGVREHTRLEVAVACAGALASSVSPAGYIPSSCCCQYCNSWGAGVEEEGPGISFSRHSYRDTG